MRAALVALVVLLTGCSFAGTPGGTATDQGTLTPAPVPSTDRPGLVDGEPVDGGALTESHRRSLSDDSYTVRYNVTVDAPNETLNDVDARAEVSPDAYVFERVERSTLSYPPSALFARIDVWYHDGVADNRFVDEGGVVRQWETTDAGQDGPVSDLSRAAEVRELLAAFEPSAVDRNAIGYRLVADGLSNPDELDTPALVTDPRNATFEARVVDGVVRRLTVRFDATFAGREVEVTRTLRVSAVGATTVEEPPWHDRPDATVEPTATTAR